MRRTLFPIVLVAGFSALVPGVAQAQSASTSPQSVVAPTTTPLQAVPAPAPPVLSAEPSKGEPIVAPVKRVAPAKITPPKGPVGLDAGKSSKVDSAQQSKKTKSALRP
jgi:hypothetical protein